MFYGPKTRAKYPILSPKVPTALITPYRYVSKNGRKQFKTGFCRYLHNPFFHTQICSLGRKWCSTLLWYHLRCLLHLWPQIVTQWATIATHLWAKMAENGWKQFFDDTYFHNILFYTQVCSTGQQRVFNYPIHSWPHIVTLWATITTHL
jgi:hypothetical protein